MAASDNKSIKRINRSSGMDPRQSTREVLETQYKLTRLEEKELNRYKKDLDKEATKTKYDYMKELENEAHKQRIKRYEEEGNKLGTWWEKNFGTLETAVSTLTTQIDKALSDYLDKYQQLSAHLSGSDSSLSDMMNTLQSTLSSTSLVKQQDVFNNLSKLVQSGITYNVEQRAFLQTLANDIDMVFNATDGSLTRLIRLQNTDLSANRAAIEYSLQKFLNQNYQNSEYIRQGFESVSRSLLEAQSTMSSQAAMSFEAAVQGQLGQMFSAGFDESTITSIANALNAAGSGQIPTGGGMSNLILMAAARAGLDYGKILNEGLNAQSANTILTSLTGYLNEMGANQSNVVRAQLGNLFGVKLSDIMAAQNLRQTSGTISTDISTLLNDYGGFQTFGNRLQNVMANVLYGFGTNMASSEGLLMGYEISKLVANSGLGTLLSRAGSALDVPILSQVLQLGGLALNNAPLIPILMSAFGENGIISDITSSLSYAGNAVSLFNAIGQKAAGSTVRISSAGSSSSAYIGTGSTSDILNSNISSLNELTSSVTTVESDRATIDENVETISNNVLLIYEILDNYVDEIHSSILNIDSNLEYSLTGLGSSMLNYRGI